MVDRSASTLHLQLGQEVIYLILTFSLFCNILLAAWAVRSMRERTVLESVVLVSKASAKTTEALEAELNSVQAELASQLLEVDRVRAGVASERAILEEEKSRIVLVAQRSNDQIPIIPLQEADGFTFADGSSDISEQFLGLLTRVVVPKIAELGERYEAQVVEVVGHTDGIALGAPLKAGSNLDVMMGALPSGGTPAKLVPFDNAGLGMARAVTVSRALRVAGLPPEFDIQPLSAANLISLGDRYEPAPLKIESASRRRIEIRLRRKYTGRLDLSR